MTPATHDRHTLKLDHLTVVSPSLAEGVAHVRACLDLDVPFGQRHGYMGTYNHVLQLGDRVYLEIVAVDPKAERPAHPRWFALDDGKKVRAEWEEGRRLRAWVARTDDIDAILAGRGHLFGAKVALPVADPAFYFTIPADGSLHREGAVPSIIDRHGKSRSMAAMADLGARLRSFTLEHPDPSLVSGLYRELRIDRPPVVLQATATRYRARIETPRGMKELA